MNVGQPGIDLTGLLAWYKMDEASGNAIDAHSTGRDLTQFGTVGSAAGKVGNARSNSGDSSNYFRNQESIFRGNGGYLYHTFWAYFNADGVNYISNVWSTNNSNDSRWLVSRTGSNQGMRLIVRADGQALQTTTSPVANLTWIFVEFYLDDINKEFGLAINRGGFETTSYSTLATSGTLDLITFRLLLISSGALNGRVDEMTFWDTPLTEARRDYLWNGGNGNTYPT